jgi:hypothetical protein
MRFSWTAQTDIPVNGSAFEANTRSCMGQGNARLDWWAICLVVPTEAEDPGFA